MSAYLKEASNGVNISVVSVAVEEKWLDQVTSGNYRQYYNSQYAKP